MNKWYVITGAPCSGKTTVTRNLIERGFDVVPEVARTYIDDSIAKGISVDELRSDELKFQNEVLDQKIELEETLPKTLTFFDRGIPDSYAYLKFLGISDPDILQKSLKGQYVKVFLLDPCVYKQDYARTESAEDQEVLHNLLHEAYEKSGATIVSVPVFSTKEARVDFILNNL